MLNSFFQKIKIEYHNTIFKGYRCDDKNDSLLNVPVVFLL